MHDPHTLEKPSKGADTRRAILDRALLVASREGLDALTIGRLATDLHLSKSGLFAHFGSKEALQIAVLDYAAERFIDRVLKPALANPRGVPRLRAMMQGLFAWGLRPLPDGGCIFMAASFELDDREGPVRDRVVQMQRDWLDAKAHAVKLAVAEGHLDPNLDPALGAQELQGIEMAAHHAHRLLGDPQAVARGLQAFERWVAFQTPSSVGGPR